MEGTLKGKNIRVPARASIWYVATSVTTKAVGLLVTPVFTRILSGEEYGEYSLYMSYLGLFSVICTVGFSSAVIYKGFQLFSKERDGFISAALGFNLCLCLAICILLFTISSVVGISPELSLVLCIQIIADSAIGLSLMQKRYVYEYKTVALVGVFESVAAPAISLLLLYGTPLGFTAKIWGLLIPAVLAASPLVLGILRKSSRLFDKQVWRFLLYRSLPLFPGIVSGAIASHVGSFVISRTLGSDALAKYSVTHSVGIGLLFVVSTLGASLAPWITRKLEAKRIDTVSEVIGVLFTLLGAATLFLIAVVPEVVGFLAPPEYGESIFAALPIALATLPSFITGVAGIGLVFSDKGGSVTLSSVVGAASSLLLSLFLTPTLTYIGAGAAQLASGVATCLVSLYCLSRARLGSAVKIHDVLPVFISTSLFGLLITLLYNYAALRILLLIIPVTVIFRTLPAAIELIKEKNC